MHLLTQQTLGACDLLKAAGIRLGGQKTEGMLKLNFPSYPVLLRVVCVGSILLCVRILNFSKLEEQNSGKLPKYIFTKKSLPNLTHFLKSPLTLITFLKTSVSFPTFLSCTSSCLILSEEMDFPAKFVSSTGTYS